MENNVFVIGGNHHNTLGVIRSLGTVGISPYLLLSSKDESPYVALSKYIKEKWIFKSDLEIISFLVSYPCERNSVLISCSDTLAYLVDTNYEVLSSKYRIPGCPQQGQLAFYMNKEVMSNVARKVGFSVPDTVVFDSKNVNSDITLPFPWIIKPLVSCEGKKSDIKRCYDRKEWEEYKNSMHCERIQIQQLIDKEFEFQLIGCSIKGGEELIIPGYAKNIRPSDVTNTGFLQYIPTSDLPIDMSVCKAFVKQTGYSGLFSMEFIHGQDGNNYFMEINFRNDGNSICVTYSGMNLPYIWVLSQLDLSYETELNKVCNMRRIYVMPEFDDLILLLKRKVNFFIWIRDFLRTDYFMEFSHSDTMPFFRALYNFVKRGVRYCWKKIMK